MKNGTSQAFIRLIVTIVLMINAALTAKGLNPIPFDETLVTECLTYIISGVSAVWIWWKNNNITAEAKAAQVLKDDMKVDGIPDVYSVMENPVDDEDVEVEVVEREYI